MQARAKGNKVCVGKGEGGPIFNQGKGRMVAGQSPSKPKPGPKGKRQGEGQGQRVGKVVVGKLTKPTMVGCKGQQKGVQGRQAGQGK